MSPGSELEEIQPNPQHSGLFRALGTAYLEPSKSTRRTTTELILPDHCPTPRRTASRWLSNHRRIYVPHPQGQISTFAPGHALTPPSPIPNLSRPWRTDLRSMAIGRGAAFQAPNTGEPWRCLLPCHTYNGTHRGHRCEAPVHSMIWHLTYNFSPAPKVT